MSRDEIRIIAFLLVGWFLYRSYKRRMLRVAAVRILAVVLMIAFGIFLVLYGKLWHAWIHNVKSLPGSSS